MNLEMEVTNILEMKAYELTYDENFPVIKILLGREGLQLIKTFMDEGKEKCKTVKGLFLILSSKFKLQHSSTKSQMKKKETARDWMDRLWTKAADCDCKEYNSLLTEQFMNGLDDRA